MAGHCHLSPWSFFFPFFFLFFFSYSTRSSYKARGWYGGDLYNGAVDSLPPGEVEQDLACLLPRKPKKVWWLCAQVLNNDK